MITRLTGILESVEGGQAVLALSSGEVAYQVMLPAYLGESLPSRVGQRITLVTLQYLDSPNQGASFVPRLIGFAAEHDRKFFELFTTVKGIGNRKALRAMACEPAAIASAIASKDVKALTRLPEIGKRLAETIIAELSGKVDAFLSPGEVSILEAKLGEGAAMAADPIGADAVEALVALGESRAEAEVLVARARTASQRDGRVLATIEAVLDQVFAARAR